MSRDADVPLDDLLQREYQSLIDQVRRAWRLGEEAAMDLVHEAIVRVYGSFANYDPEKGDFRGWVWGILKHASLRRPEKKPEAREPEEASPLADLVGEEVSRFVHGSVGALPEAYRKTVELRYYQGLPLAEIAKIQGVPLGTVKARLSRAPDMLRQSLTVQATTARLFLEHKKKSRK
jgi:RNA polymerase sigma-70 factor (ECF subfamily)